MLTSQLLGSIAGAVAIFSNTSYYSAYVHDGTNHKAISIGDSSFTGLVDNVAQSGSAIKDISHELEETIRFFQI